MMAARAAVGPAWRDVRLAQALPVDSVTQLARDGAVLQVQVSNLAGGTPQTVRGLIDTGASISGVRPQVAQAAGLIQTGSVEVSGVTGTEKRPVYAAGVGLPEYGVSFEAVELAGLQLPSQDLHFLLGRDILKDLVLTYHGSSGSVELRDGGTDLTTLLAAGGIALGALAVLVALGAFK